MLRAGILDRRIELQQRVETQDSSGQVVYSWLTLSPSLPASYEPQRGVEFFTAQALTVKRPAAFRIRWKAGIVEQMRVLFEGDIWDITFVMPVGRKKELLLYCQSGLTEG